MSFRFKKSESPAKALRRIGRERVGAALNCLREAKRPAAVHGARKEIKKLRALFRLVRGEIGVRSYRRGVKALRTISDSLAATRDARVMLKAFEKLTAGTGNKYTRIGRALRKHARREARRFCKDRSVAAAERLLRKTEHRLGDWKVDWQGWSDLAPGLKRAYERGRAAGEIARCEPATEHFHEWRRRVKDLWYDLCLLYPLRPAALRASVAGLERLGMLLGDDHDLFLVHQFIGRLDGKESKQAKTLDRLVLARQKELRTAALKLGARLFAEVPDKFYRRIDTLRP